MQRHELQERLGDREMSDHEWDIASFVYTWHPSIKDVGGKDQIADLIKKNYHAISDMMPEALESAKAQGVNIKTQRGLLVDYDVYEGYCYNERGRSIKDIFQDVTAQLKERDLEPDEYWCISNGYGKDKLEYWPTQWVWVACYVVRGGSEGHYIHVDLITRGDSDQPEGKRQMVFLGKTLQEGKEGMAYACSIANALTEILHCH